jgi:hypothetical protein
MLVPHRFLMWILSAWLRQAPQSGAQSVEELSGLQAVPLGRQAGYLFARQLVVLWCATA